MLLDSSVPSSGTIVVQEGGTATMLSTLNWSDDGGNYVLGLLGNISILDTPAMLMSILY